MLFLAESLSILRKALVEDSMFDLNGVAKAL